MRLLCETAIWEPSYLFALYVILGGNTSESKSKSEIVGLFF